MALLEKHAFHGDNHLIGLFDELLPRSSSFVETGSAEGRTVAYVAQRFPGMRVFSCEIHPPSLAKARARCAQLRNVEISSTRSPEFLHELLTKTPAIKSEVTTYWLDAHWDGYWPLLDELRFLFAHVDRAFIAIDDFKVPSRSEFGFDCYGGQECSLDYIAPVLRTREHSIILPKYGMDSKVLNQLRGTCTIIVGQKGLSFSPELMNSFEILN